MLSTPQSKNANNNAVVISPAASPLTAFVEKAIEGTKTSLQVLPSANGNKNQDDAQTRRKNDTPPSLPRKIKLDVGGLRYTTSRSTLCRVPGSLLEAMFSGRHQHAAIIDDDDGSYFIDRNGQHFRYILDFLRHGAVITLPKTQDEKTELAVEAEYYGLNELVMAIRSPEVDISECLSPEALAIREYETAARSNFVCSRKKYESKRNVDKYKGLIPIFCPDHGLESLPLIYEPIDQEDDLFLKDIRNDSEEGDNVDAQQSSGKHIPVTVESIAQFRRNFNRDNPNILARLSSVLREEPIIIAGGSILRALTGSDGIRTNNWWGGSFSGTSDIDIFICCGSTNVVEANRIAERIFYALSSANLEKWVVMRCKGVINIHSVVNEEVGEKVQIVLRLFDSLTEVLFGFDVDCACCAYDGEQVWASQRCIAALRTGVNILNPLHSWPNKPSYELRLGKYAFRGFAVQVPAIDKNRIDHGRFLRVNLDGLRGLARFIKVVQEMESSVKNRRYRWDRQTRRTITVERQRAPLEIKTLRDVEISCATEDEKIISCFEASGYDGSEYGVFVPSVYYKEDQDDFYPNLLFWQDLSDARDTRDEAWMEIEEIKHDSTVPDGIPTRLEDAWETEKKSREYLNGSMDKIDLDSVYYSYAYRDTKK